jgi:superfamily II DNA or RNA helicase
MDLKAVVSNRIYLKGSDSLIENIKKTLTHKIEHFVPGKKVKSIELIRNYKLLPQGVISIPRGRTDLIPEDYEIVDKRVRVSVPFPTPLYNLREGQQIVYDSVNSDCFINALVGWGKTSTALHIARKLGQKTLVVTHTTMLRDQWVKEVEKLYGIECGIIGAGVFDIDHAIVIGNVQTVTKHALALSKEFGTLIIDECHHVAATTFSEIVDASHAKYRIGLSGTMIRKDGKHILFKDFFGDVVFKPPQSNTLNPRVKIIKTGIRLNADEPWAKRINTLLYDPDYQQYVATIAATQINRGHKVLVIADRVEFLQNVKNWLGESCLLVTGQTDLETREAIKSKIESGEASSIAGSRQIFSEGISVNPLSCVILASPISNESLLEQIIGRIMREWPGKLHPLVIDLNFSGPTDRKQNELRWKFYLEKGWEVEAL